jgi:hypothetical protein
MARRRPIVFTDDGSHLDRFGILLLLTAASITILMLVDLEDPTRSLWAELGWLSVTIIVGVTLSLAFRASGVSRRLQRIGDIVVVVTVVVVMLTSLVSRIDGAPDVFGGKPSLAWAVLALLSPVLVLRRVLAHKVVTGQTLAGALAAYLLIAVAFNYTFTAVTDMGNVQFFGAHEPTTSFMYFSLVTITTLGYGDLQPVTAVARFLSTTEAVLGQILLVTVVARLVGLYSRRPSEDPTGSESESHNILTTNEPLDSAEPQ